MIGGFLISNASTAGTFAPTFESKNKTSGGAAGFARAAGDPGTPLPCPLSDNSDGNRVTASAGDRKRAETTRRNISHFAAEHGLATGVLTITFAEDLSVRDAQRKRANFVRRVLRELFGEMITVREFTRRGRPHFHAVVDCQGDVTTGFNWAHHDAIIAWNKNFRKGAKPRGSLNRSDRLVECHRVLNAKGPLYGLGRIELTPVRDPGAIGFYLGGYLAKSEGNKPADAKGTRAVSYSHKCRRVFYRQWSWSNESSWLWRAKLRTWAMAHGCATLPEVAAFFGPRWAYHHREQILGTRLDFYPTSEHARRDGVSDIPEGAVDIRITRGLDVCSDREAARGSVLGKRSAQRRHGALASSCSPLNPHAIPAERTNLAADGETSRQSSPVRLYSLRRRNKTAPVHYQRPLIV